MDRRSKVVRLLLAALAVAFLAEEVARAGETADDEPFYQQISRAVIRLERVVRGDGVETHRWHGTAFFVEHLRDDKSYYLVTARHVVEVRSGSIAQRISLRARVPSQRNDTGETDIIELRIPGEAWIFHSEDARTIKRGDSTEPLSPVDVAIAKVSGILDRRVRTIGYCPDPCPESSKDKHQFLTADPLPPQQVLVWGFPGDLGFTLEEQRPMGRVGIMAMTAREPYIRSDNVLRDERVILLDVRMFPGNSGGPVFAYPALGPIRLAGLISATNMALSYAIAEPISRIAEAMETAYQTEMKVKGSWHLLQRSTGN